MNASDFVPSPRGQYDFGEIPSAIATAAGIASGKIRLRLGDASTGLTHIVNTRGKMIREQYGSVEQFVLYVATHDNAIYLKKNSRAGQAYDVVVNPTTQQSKSGTSHLEDSKRFRRRLLRCALGHADTRRPV